MPLEYIYLPPTIHPSDSPASTSLWANRAQARVPRSLYIPSINPVLLKPEVPRLDCYCLAVRVPAIRRMIPFPLTNRGSLQPRSIRNLSRCTTASWLELWHKDAVPSVRHSHLLCIFEEFWGRTTAVSAFANHKIRLRRLGLAPATRRPISDSHLPAKPNSS